MTNDDLLAQATARLRLVDDPNGQLGVFATIRNITAAFVELEKVIDRDPGRTAAYRTLARAQGLAIEVLDAVEGNPLLANQMHDVLRQFDYPEEWTATFAKTWHRQQMDRLLQRAVALEEDEQRQATGDDPFDEHPLVFGDVSEVDKSLVAKFVQQTYIGRTILSCVVERRPTRPAEDGQDPRIVAEDLLRSCCRLGDLERVRRGEVECFLDTFGVPIESSFPPEWFVVVSLLADRQCAAPPARGEVREETVGEYKIEYSSTMAADGTYDLRIHRVSHQSGLTTGYFEVGINPMRNLDPQTKEVLLDSIREEYRNASYREFEEEVRSIKASTRPS